MAEENKKQAPAPGKEKEVPKEEEGYGLKQIAIIFAFCMLGDLLYRAISGGNGKERKPAARTDTSVEPVGTEEGYNVAKEINKDAGNAGKAGHKRYDVSDEAIEKQP